LKDENPEKEVTRNATDEMVISWFFHFWKRSKFHHTCFVSPAPGVMSSTHDWSTEAISAIHKPWPRSHFRDE